MTEHDLDDLASDLIDGLLPADRAADALRDPAVARRVEEMRAAQALLRDVPPPSAARREAALATALDAASPAAGAASVGGPHTVSDLASHRTARWWRDPRWLSAAAVILVVLAIGGLVAANNTTGGGDSDSAAQVSESESGGDDASAGADSGAASSGAAPDAQAQEAAPTTTSAPPSQSADSDVNAMTGTLDLGDAGSLAELADRASGDAAARPDAADETTADALASGELEATIDRCAAPSAVDGADAVDLVARARLDGVPVVVWVVREGDARRMIVVDGACVVVGERTLPG